MVFDNRLAGADRSADQVLILQNAKAGARSGRSRVEALVGLLQSQRLATRLIDHPQELAQASQESMEQGRLKAVVAAGGDGTAALAINKTPRGAPIAVLPLGTENLLAKYLGIRGPEEVLRAIVHGVPVPLDVGQANGRLFLLMLSCGFDAHVVQRLHEGRRGHIRHLSYAKPIFHSLRTYDYPEIRITRLEGASDASDHPPCDQQSARWVFVMNLPCYARGLPIAPRASGVDGLLDVCTFRRGSWWNALRYLGGVLLGRHHQDRDCTQFQARRLRLEADLPTPYQIDGDPGGLLPVEVELLPGRLNLLAPAEWAARQGTVSPAQAGGGAACAAAPQTASCPLPGKQLAP